MAAPRGTRPPNAGKGRKKGAVNKITAELKEMIQGALVEVGGQEYLARQARKNPTAFLALLGKTLPKDLNLKTTGGLRLSISLSKPCQTPPSTTSAPAP